MKEKSGKHSYCKNDPKFDPKSHDAMRARAPERVSHSAKQQRVTTTHRYAPASKAKSSRV
jgi:hypothetical protein